MKTPNLNPRRLAQASALALICGTSHAATVTISGGANTTSNWDQNWNNATVASAGSGNLLPAASVPDTAIINQNRTVQVDSVIDVVAGNVNINNTNGGTFNDVNLEINSGGSLSTGTLVVSANDDAGHLKVQGGALTSSSLDVRANGTVTASSGTLNAGAVTIRGGSSTTGAVNVSGATVTATGTTTVESGTLNGSLNVSGGTYAGAGFAVNGNVNVSGTGAVTAAGDTTVNDGGTYEVSGGTVAASSNKIVVNTGGNFNVSGGAVTAQSSGTNSSSAALQLSGGNITVSSGTLTVSEFSAGGGTTYATNGAGTLNVSGGTFKFDGATAASDTIFFSNDVINITGGTFDAAGGQVIFTNNTQVNIIGDSATITMDALNLATASRMATLNFVLGSSGASTINNNSFMGLSHATLLVDGSAYTGGIGAIDLLLSSNLSSGFASGNYTVTGLGDEGVHWELEQTLGSGTGNGDVRINVLSVVPEPGSALMALLGLGGLLVRRRR